MRRTYTRRILVVVCSLVMLLSMYPLEAAAVKTVKVWTGYPENVPVFEAAAADYMKEHSDVKIEVTAYNLRDSEQKYAIALPAGTAPDLYDADAGLVNRYAALGLLDSAPKPIENWLKDNFDPVYVKTLSADGLLYAVPWTHGFQVMYYNLNHYREAGITAPPKTLDELMSHARKLAKYDSKGNLVRSGMSLRISGGGMGVAEKFEVFLFAEGGSVFKPTAPGKWKANFANEAGFKALNFYLQAIHKYKVDGYNVKHDAEAFVTGATSQFNRETWVIGEAKSLAPNMNYGICQIPRGDVQQATNLALGGFIVPKSSKNKDIAWDFAQYINRDKYLAQLMRDVGWIATRNGVDYSEVYVQEPHFEQALDRPADMRLIPLANAKSTAEAYTKFAARLVDVFADPSMTDNKAKIMKFLNEAADEVNQILESYGEYADE